MLNKTDSGRTCPPTSPLPLCGWSSRSVVRPAGDIKQESGLYREGPSYQRRGSLQLWQFLVALLDDPSNSHFIAWTGRGMEFKLIEPEEVREKVLL